ncbi:MAG: acyltransferase [Rhodospirillaceae bacterium]|nr:acyltransferase [Rhodospirillaceae bacterium]
MNDLASSTSVRVSVVQMQMMKDKKENLDHALSLVSKAVNEQGAQLVCLPELFTCMYFCQTKDIKNFEMAETVPGPITFALEELANKLEVTLVTSIFERRIHGVYHNTAVVIDGKKGYLGKYRKMHIPDELGYEEKFYFAPGDLGFKSFNTSIGECGALVCWDQWYPEAARLTVLDGAQILIYPTSIGWHPEEKDTLGPSQIEAWEVVQRGHAISNGCFVVVSNRVGFEEHPTKKTGIEFWGQSFIVAPDGRILNRASSTDTEIITVDLDLSEVEEARTSWPFMRDRRVDAYGDLAQRSTD